MIRHKWIVGVRNKLADMCMECDSCAAIEGSKLTSTERRELQAKLRDAIHYIEERINK